MADVIEAKFGPRAPADLPEILRELADAVERGDITCMAFAFIEHDRYMTQRGGNLRDCLVLADLLRERVLDEIRQT